ncbi:DUF192 domain-containing protein [Candidatus Omnitrophota bacterium]
MKRVLIIISIFLLLFSSSPCFSLERGLVCFQDYCYSVELAQTAEQRSLGLMFREHLDPDQGMLFIYPEQGNYSFWMKNTLIPLDMIWINKDQAVVFIGQDIQPCRAEPCPKISPDCPAKYVLELNSGTVDKIGLKIGDQLEFDID